MKRTTAELIDVRVRSLFMVHGAPEHIAENIAEFCDRVFSSVLSPFRTKWQAIVNTINPLECNLRTNLSPVGPHRSETEQITI